MLLLLVAAVSEVSSPNGVSPLLLYCAACVSAAHSAQQPLDAAMTLQCADTLDTRLSDSPGTVALPAHLAQWHTRHSDTPGTVAHLAQ